MKSNNIKLNDIYNPNNDKLTYDDLNYRKRVITLDDNIDLENLAEPEFVSTLSPEEELRRNTLWKDIEFVCGGKTNSKYIIMYMHYYLRKSLRYIAKQLGVTHTAIDKRRISTINALRYLYGLPSDRVPYRKSRGNKLS